MGLTTFIGLHLYVQVLTIVTRVIESYHTCWRSWPWLSWVLSPHIQACRTPDSCLQRFAISWCARGNFGRLAVMMMVAQLWVYIVSSYTGYTKVSSMTIFLKYVLCTPLNLRIKQFPRNWGWLCSSVYVAAVLTSCIPPYALISTTHRSRSNALQYACA